jgi:hypothetical protein
MPQSPSGDLKVGVDIDAIDNKKVPIDPDALGGAGDTMVLGTEVHAMVLSKLDWHLLPLVSLLYLLSFL